MPDISKLLNGSNLDTFEYNLDYFSGAQASIYIEEILVDEVTSLQWTVQQSKVPIYGYASQTFDEMANGTIIVQGSFSINFTHSGYLWSILENREKEIMSTAKSIDEGITRSILQKAEENPDPNSTNEIINGYRKLIDAKRKGLNTGNITKYMNDIIWGSDNTVKKGKPSYENRLRTDRRELNGFDIYLQFKHDGVENYSVRKIQDVHLIGKAQTVVIDENPVQEVYSFYAKNVI